MTRRAGHGAAKAVADPRPHPGGVSVESRRRVWLAAGCIAGFGLIAYHNLFSAPFVFDDIPAIVDNPTIRHLWPIGDVLSPPPDGVGVVGRPLVNASFAVNYALGGTRVWGYHALNLVLHLLTGLTLFGIVRRTLGLPRLQRFRRHRLSLAFGVAGLWVVHPLQTAAVAFTAQRTECLAGLFYCLTLYCVIRGVGSSHPSRWYVLSTLACLSGMASKEVMVTAPLMVLLYDRTFITGSFRRAWHQRRPLYFALGSTWLLLADLVLSSHQREGAAGFGLGTSALAYALTQCRAIVHYLRLAAWPHPLVFDYGFAVVTDPAQVWIEGLVVGLLVTGTVVALVRWPVLGFPGAWLLGILAPTSSVVPLTRQTMAEHRMYLPLAAVLMLLAWGVHAVTRRRALPVLIVLGALLGWRTVRRNEDYRSALALWSDTVAKWPENPRAHNNLGLELFALGRLTEAWSEYQEALRIRPDSVSTRNNMGVLLMRQGRSQEAVEQFEYAIRLAPTYAPSHHGLGNALERQGQIEEAIAAHRRALELLPDFVDARFDLARLLVMAGQVEPALEEYQRALALRPEDTLALTAYGVLLAQAGRAGEALAQLEESRRLDPTSAVVRFNTGSVLLQAGRAAEAIAAYEQALLLKPDYVDALLNLGNALANSGRPHEAVARFDQVLRLVPQHAAAHNNLAVVLLRLGNVEGAKEHYRKLVDLKPDDARARAQLARLSEQ